MAEEKFNEDYFEHGVEKHISGYENYRWLAHYVLPLANTLKKRYGKVDYLDYGCAKGYLVKALRMLGCEAYGYDTSKYAINNGDLYVKKYLYNELPNTYSYSGVIIAKDVLEHIPYDKLDEVLSWMNEHTSNLVVIVPLGDGKLFRIREYEIDKTHIIRQDEEWWINKFFDNGFEVDEFYYKLDGFKDNWTEKYPYGNGIFFLKRMW